MPCPAAYGVSSNNAGYKGNEELYLYLVTGYSGSLEKTPKEIESTFDLKDCYLANQQVDIARTIRNEEADPIRNKLKRRLLESAPEVIDNFESIEDAIRSQEFSKFDQLLPARCDRNLVASFCYWRLSKEVIGDDSGLTLGHISAAFKMQATPFRKRIEPVTIPWTCPKCGGTAHINDLRLNSKGGLGTAALKCTSCNHVEAIGERNALDCKCAACDILRSEYLGNVADAAKGCMESLVDSLLEYAKSSHKTALQHSPWFDGSQADIWMGYSKLRQAGHGPRKAAGALLSGTTLEHGFDCRVSPFWILAGSKAGVFDLGAVEHLDGDLARQFVTESILKDLRKTKGLEHVSSFEMFEQILASKDINLVEQAVNYYFRSPDNGMPLPYRWKATENPQKILALAQEANRLGLIPKHLAANTEWYDRSRHGVELAPEEVPAWGHKQT